MFALNFQTSNETQHCGEGEGEKKKIPRFSPCSTDRRTRALPRAGQSPQKQQRAENEEGEKSEVEKK